MIHITSPQNGARIAIGSDGTLPPILVTTDVDDLHTWRWSVRWRHFTASGVATSLGTSWDAASVLANYGGEVTLSVRTNAGSASVHFTIYGTNPSAAELRDYLNSLPGSQGFSDIVTQESRGRHFDRHGMPVRSFDNGYGLCQLTHPAPTAAQVWNWKRNIDAGLLLFAAKLREAQNFLGQARRGYTQDQLIREAVSRWNGGPYHEWNAQTGQWQRRHTVMCDTATGNIGWDMTNPANAGQTEADLHRRDGENYRRGRQDGDNWRYFGVCYADHILGAPPAPPPPPPAPPRPRAPAPANRPRGPQVRMP